MLAFQNKPSLYHHFCLLQHIWLANLTNVCIYLFSPRHLFDPDVLVASLFSRTITEQLDIPLIIVHCHINWIRFDWNVSIRSFGWSICEICLYISGIFRFIVEKVQSTGQCMGIIKMVHMSIAGKKVRPEEYKAFDVKIKNYKYIRYKYWKGIYSSIWYSYWDIDS